MATLEQGQRAIRRLIDALEDDTDELAQEWASGILAAAQDRASSRPTPQAPMAAEAMVAQRGSILNLSGGPPSEVAGGSEFGSTIYRQFGPRNTRGYWLLPSAEDPGPATMAKGEDWLDETVGAAVRGI